MHKGTAAVDICHGARTRSSTSMTMRLLRRHGKKYWVQHDKKGQHSKCEDDKGTWSKCAKTTIVIEGETRSTTGERWLLPSSRRAVVGGKINVPTMFSASGHGHHVRLTSTFWVQKKTRVPLPFEQEWSCRKLHRWFPLLRRFQ